MNVEYLGVSFSIIVEMWICLFSFFKKYLNVPNVLVCLASTGKLFQSLSVEDKKKLLY